MKTLLKYSVAAALVALGLKIVMGWPFWTIFILLEVSYAIYRLHSSHPRTAKWSAVIIIAALLGGWAFGWFRGNLPLSYNTLPYGKNWHDAKLTGVIDPGLSKARSVLVLELRKKEDALATEIPNLMQAKKYAEMGTNVQELIDLRKQIDKLLAQTVPPPPPPALTTAPSKIQSTLPGVTLEITLTNDQVLTIHDDIRQGQSWRYLSFMGDFNHRIDKGGGNDYWKLVNNNLPWTADFPGKLQVKAGNTPVKMTVYIAP